jgi:hypothetical protein
MAYLPETSKQKKHPHIQGVFNTLRCYSMYYVAYVVPSFGCHILTDTLKVTGIFVALLVNWCCSQSFWEVLGHSSNASTKQQKKWTFAMPEKKNSKLYLHSIHSQQNLVSQRRYLERQKPQKQEEE